ncbi:helicase-associated domain-containing protein [Pseudactinotalea sp. HY158]|uniref:helicase-associated domain-containing protein n=1 Tax=Pseudactinotalea sp. HY158 TaxID=2654547 RepID=UPI00129CF9C8|nr:helicase-associated domain-containing protein [Pseudactinotalea sp. HY158]QGH68535.1 hypothetical protein GCE65_02685 [Pseudactinotalea sp. HY158]
MRTDLMRRLRAASDGELTALVHARQDLATPQPSSTAALAVRALSPASVQRALGRLPAPPLRAAEALAIGRVPAAPVELAGALGTSTAEAADRLAELTRLALVLDEELVPAAAEALRGTPWHRLTLGLGPAVPDVAPDPGLVPATPAALTAILAGAPPAAAAMVRSLARGPATGSHPEGEVPDAVTWLLAHHVLARISPTQVVLPREVGLAVRAPHVATAAPPAPPTPAGAERMAAMVTAEALEAAGAFLRRIGGLLDLWGEEPATVLRSGGLGVRELRAAAARLESSSARPQDLGRFALAVQVADAAGLIGIHAGLDADGWAPTLRAGGWAGSSPGEQWAACVRAWLEQTQVSWLVGSAGNTARRTGIRAALTPEVDRAWAPALRRQVLEALAAWPDSHAPALTDLTAHLAWHSPRSAPPAETVAAVCAEAAELGLVAAGALTVLGRAVLEPPGRGGSGPDALAAAWARVAPAPVDELIIQGDLTGIVPGPPSRELGELVELAALTESHGQGLTVRFTPGSVAAALERGLSAEELLERLRARSRTPLPQALEYLIEDAGRRHGSIRVGAVGCYVRASAPALAELVADPRLGLRLLAPTVAVSTLGRRPCWACCARRGRRPGPSPPVASSSPTPAPRCGPRGPGDGPRPRRRCRPNRS